MDQEEGSPAEQINDILGKYTIRFAPDRGADAREILSYQRAAWTSFMELLGVRTIFREHESAYRVITGVIDAHISENPPEFKTGSDGLIVVESNFPLLLQADDGRRRELIQAEEWLVLAAVITRFRVFMGKALTLISDADRFAIAKLFSDARVLVALVDFRASFQSQQLRQSFRDAAVEVREAINEAKGNALIQAGDWTRLMEESEAGLGVLEKNLTDASAQRAAEFEAFIVEAKASIEAARKQATEAGILLSATRLWARKAIQHGVGFWIGLLAMAGIVGTGLCMAYLHGPAFLASLPKKADGEVTYVTVALITICAIAAGWLLRFIGRFVTENMVLQTDADQRRVMLQTYLALVGDKDAKMEQADRTLVLNAVFRPLPGHQSEDVAPPTLLDLAKSVVPVGDKK